MRASKELPLTTAAEAERYRRSGAWPDETVYERFARIAGKHADKVAVIEATRSLTYRQMLDHVQALSRGLLDSGIRAGDVVAVQVPNSAEQPIAHLALNRIGALAMPVHESWHEAELPHLLKLGKAVAAIVLSSYRDLDYPAIYAACGAQLPDLKHVYAIGAPSPHADALRLAARARQRGRGRCPRRDRSRRAGRPDAVFGNDLAAEDQHVLEQQPARPAAAVLASHPHQRRRRRRRARRRRAPARSATSTRSCRRCCTARPR